MGVCSGLPPLSRLPARKQVPLNATDPYHLGGPPRRAKKGKSRSILSLLYYFFSVDINNTNVFAVDKYGNMRKLDHRPSGYIDSQLFFDSQTNENAALIELQSTLLNFKREVLEQ